MDKRQLDDSESEPQHYEAYELWGGDATFQSRCTRIKDIIRRERNHQELVQAPHFSQGESDTVVIGDEQNFRKYLVRVEKFAVRSASNKDQAIKTENRKGCEVVSLTSIGKIAWQLCIEFDSEVVRFYSHHQFKPSIAVVLDALKKWAGPVVVASAAHGSPDMRHPEAAKLIGSFLFEVRSGLKSRKVQSAIKNHRRMERQNFNSCLKYMRFLFGKRSRILVLRVDFYYRPLAREWGASLEAQSVHTKFLRSLREDRIVKDVIGYLSKREVGVDRGTHFHVLIALDGHKHRNAAKLSRMIGEHWVEACGKESVGAFPRASYFNCYTLRDKYEFNCIGLVNVNDEFMMKGVEIAIRYMCKETCHLKAVPIETMDGSGKVVRKEKIGKRNIRKGIAKVNTGKKRGAPRKSSNVKGTCGMFSQRPLHQEYDTQRRI